MYQVQNFPIFVTSKKLLIDECKIKKKCFLSVRKSFISIKFFEVPSLKFLCYRRLFCLIMNF